MQNTLSFGDQITSDQIPRSLSLLSQETFYFIDKDNDNFGDGDKRDCEEMQFDLPMIDTGLAVGLMILMLFVGATASLAGMYIYKRYKKAKANQLSFK